MSDRRRIALAGAATSTAVASVAIGCGLGALALALGAAGYDAGAAMRALWMGSLGSGYALLSASLVRATPLILTGLAVALAFRASVWNIGAEGQLLAGAAAATIVALGMPMVPRILLVPVTLLAGAIAGALWAGIAAVLRRRFAVLEVISTIMLNFVALYVVGYLVRGPLQEPTHAYPQSSSIAEHARLPLLVSGTRLHLGFVIALIAAVAQWWVLRATAAGFRVRASGDGPAAAESAGSIDVARITERVFLVSGALAGLAGAIEVGGVTFALYENLSPGYGYTAIAVALLARLDALGVVATGILFGALESGALAMQREAGVPSVVVSVVEAAVVLLVLFAAWWRDSWTGLPGTAAPSAKDAT